MIATRDYGLGRYAIADRLLGLKRIFLSFDKLISERPLSSIYILHNNRDGFKQKGV